jgi:hypothetical protein
MVVSFQPTNGSRLPLECTATEPVAAASSGAALTSERCQTLSRALLGALFSEFLVRERRRPRLARALGAGPAARSGRLWRDLRRSQTFVAARGDLIFGHDDASAPS